MTQVVAGGFVYEVSLKDLTAFGAASVKRSIKGIRDEAEQTDISLKSLAKDTAILGTSLAALGGTALIAGTAIGGEFGQSLQIAGAGMAVVGSSLATIVPAFRALSVVIDGTLIPALVRLNAFLGPYGWIVVGLGIAAAAIGTFIYMQDRAKESMKGYSLSAEDAKRNLEGLNDALKERMRLEQELAGIPAKKGELEFELTGAKIAEARSKEYVDKLAGEGVTGTEFDAAVYAYLSDKRRRERIEASIGALGGVEPALKTVSQEVSARQAAQTLGTTYEQTSQWQFMAGSGQPETGKYSLNTGGMNVGMSAGQFRDLIIEINGTVSNETITVPHETLGDQAAKQGLI